MYQLHDVFRIIALRSITTTAAQASQRRGAATHRPTFRSRALALLSGVLVAVTLAACSVGEPVPTVVSGAWESTMYTDRYEFVLDGTTLTGEAYYANFVGNSVDGVKHVGSLTGTVDELGNATWTVVLDDGGWTGTEKSKGRFVGGHFNGTWQIYRPNGSPYSNGTQSLVRVGE